MVKFTYSYLLLERVGLALYGPEWRSPMARELGVALRTVQRMSTGERRISPQTWRALRDLAHLGAHQLSERAVFLLEFAQAESPGEVLPYNKGN
jgi:hypothetical protein